MINKKKIIIYTFIICLLITISAIFLYAYDERIEIEEKDNASYIEKIIETSNDNDVYVNIREDELYSEKKDSEKEKEKEIKENIENKKDAEKKQEKEIKENIENKKDTEKKQEKKIKENAEEQKENGIDKNNDDKYDIYYKDKTYAFDPTAHYFIKKQEDPKYENIVYSKSFTNEEMGTGKFFNYSLYKIEYENYNENKKRVKRVSRYTTNYYLIEFRDYIYNDEINKKYPVKIQTYDNFATPTSYEIWNYNNLGQVIEKIIYKDDKEYKKYLYDYDIKGNQIIRIEKVEDNIVEKRYSYYNDDNRLERREFFKFKTLMRTYIYKYYQDKLYIKKMYDSTEMLVRTFHYRNDDKAEEIILSLLPEIPVE